MKLRFYRQSTRHSYHNNETIFKRCSPSELTISLKTEFNNSTFLNPNIGNELNAWVSTQVVPSWDQPETFRFWKRWMLALDCDSIQARDQAIEELRSLNLTYEIIESSPGRFWILVDYIKSFRKCINLMDTIPGVDIEYKTHCRLHRKIFLRAFPKNGYIPNFTSYPSLDYIGKLWYREFGRWMTTGICEWLANHQRNMAQIITLQKQAEKKVEDKAAPNRTRRRRIEVDQDELR